MKNVLVIQYSQTGQLSSVLKSMVEPLQANAEISVTVETLKPKEAFPFPWPIFKFFDTFPETVYQDAPALEPLSNAAKKRFDLVILGYQAWFLSPSLPATAFLKSPEAKEILKDTPVVSVVACRDMWLMAQEEIKKLLADCGARLVGHVALVDEAGTVGSFFATPVWMMTGQRGPHLGGLIPRAGVKPEQIAESRRFGERISTVLSTGQALDDGLLKGMGAARVNTGLISSEKAIRRGFKVWGKLLRAIGPHGSFQRKPVLVFYILWLVFAIIVFVPLGFLLRTLLGPLRRKSLDAQKAYYSAPSGI